MSGLLPALRHGSDVEAHHKAVQEGEKQQREERAIPAGVVLVAVVCLAAVGLWAGVVTALAHLW
ncbi:hypothetical protein [Streptomyces sp. NPDC059863]|uniref:hypothetical protein n=1 Tax=unclassified Streptomyces TaxID=2593676 RepID=UPI00365923EC